MPDALCVVNEGEIHPHSRFNPCIRLRWMKPLTSLLLGLMLASSVGASPSSEEFVIRAIRESKETTVIQEAAPVRSLPAPPPKPIATDSAIPSKLIEVVWGPQVGMGQGFTAAQLPMVSASARAR